MSRGQAPNNEGEDGPVNVVRVRGRLTSAPTHRTLPSGDEVVSLAVTVDRPAGGVDTVPVQVGPVPASGRRPRSGQPGRRLLTSVARLAVGDVVEVDGSLRRRWWAAGGGRRSTIEVAAQHVRRLPG